MRATEQELRLRITLRRPPEGVRFALQRGRSDLVDAQDATGADLSFDLTVRVRYAEEGLPPRFLGPFTQGPPAARFVYVNSGKSAGQTNTCWDRRAKIPLTTITTPLIAATVETRGAVLEAVVQGTGKDGGPVCASVQLLDGGWHVQYAEPAK